MVDVVKVICFQRPEGAKGPFVRGEVRERAEPNLAHAPKPKRVSFATRSPGRGVGKADAKGLVLWQPADAPAGADIMRELRLAKECRAF